MVADASRRSESSQLERIGPFDFLNMAGVRDRAWWRLLVAVLAVVGLVAIMTVTLRPLEALLSGLLQKICGSGVHTCRAVWWSEGLAEEVSDALFGLVLAVAPVVFLAWLNARPALSWLTAAPRFRWRLLFASMILFAAATGLYWWIVGRLVHRTIHFSGWLPGGDLSELFGQACLLAGVISLAVAAELYLRGWLLQVIGLFTRRLVVVLVLSALLPGFVMLVLLQEPMGAVSMAIKSLVLAYAVLRTGGLEFVIGAHISMNLIDQLLLTPSVAGHPWTGQLVAQAGLGLGVFLLVELVVRWKPLSRLAGLRTI